MKLVEVLDDNRAVAKQAAGELTIDVSLIENPQPGDYVIVHAGYALETVESEDAQERITLLRGIEE